ncbi:MAG: hypothetical protein J7M01_02700 [Candidatus Marinimicrobia bacterium]|nr:hypothetical protein [Candidatus Neomarinimicrobiota bacterium]
MKFSNIKIKIMILLASLIFSQFALGQGIDMSGFVRTYEGINVENGNFSIIQQTLNLNFEKRGNKVTLKANPMAYLYNQDSLSLGLREIYMDMYFKNFDLRLGKQQIVWGKADGVFITDIVSPLNLSEFLLPNFDEIRTGIISAKLDYYIGNSTIEAIWIPQFASTTRPDANSIWYIEPEFPVTPTFDWSQSTIDPSLENSEIFLKWSAMTSKLDFELMGGYTWDDNPSMHVQKQFGINNATTPPTPMLTGLTITPQHHRLAVAGGSFGAEILGVILRGEGAYYSGKYFQSEDPLAENALVQKDYLNYVVGLDFSIGNVIFSTQFIQKYILDHEELMSEDEFQNTATFVARYNMLRETLHLELFSYIGLSNKDALIRPKISYDFDDSFSLHLGANIFVGDRDGQFGQYQDNSMIYTKIKYSF